MDSQPKIVTLFLANGLPLMRKKLVRKKGVLVIEEIRSGGGGTPIKMMGMLVVPALRGENL